MLLDLSAAFDTVEQAKLLTILRNEIGVVGTAFKWLESVLTERSQKVKNGDTYSEETKLPFGVAQSSVLGPDLFNIYIRSLYHYIQPSKFNIFGFADDRQLLQSFLPILEMKALDNDINHYVSRITRWMYEYFLCLNPSTILASMPPTMKESDKWNI